MRLSSDGRRSGVEERIDRRARAGAVRVVKHGDSRRWHVDGVSRAMGGVERERVRRPRGTARSVLAIAREFVAVAHRSTLDARDGAQRSAILSTTRAGRWSRGARARRVRVTVRVLLGLGDRRPLSREADAHATTPTQTPTGESLDEDAVTVSPRASIDRFVEDAVDEDAVGREAFAARRRSAQTQDGILERRPSSGVRLACRGCEGQKETSFYARTEARVDDDRRGFTDVWLRARRSRSA